MRLGLSFRYRSSVSSIRSTKRSRTDKATALKSSLIERSFQGFPNEYLACRRMDSLMEAIKSAVAGFPTFSMRLVFEGMYRLFSAAVDIKNPMHADELEKPAHLFRHAAQL